MAPDPDKRPKEERKKSKYPLGINAQYEKKRRDIFNEKIEGLAQLLPNFDKE